MGGKCENFYIPESRAELIDICNRIAPPRYILSGGSNIVINDKKTFENVIFLREFDKEIRDLGEGRFYVGASVRLQKLILTINNLGYGGIEYLFSVPGLVGGAVTMNAGRGRNHGNSISDYISMVYVYRNGSVEEVSKQECAFSHRQSCFLKSDDIVLGVVFAFERVERNEAERLRNERVLLCKETQDMSYPNFGTVFCEANMKLMKVVSIFESSHSQIGYSKQTINWMLNRGGSFSLVLKKLNYVKALHTILRQKCRQEVVLWR